MKKLIFFLSSHFLVGAIPRYECSLQGLWIILSNIAVKIFKLIILVHHKQRVAYRPIVLVRRQTNDLQN